MHNLACSKFNAGNDLKKEGKDISGASESHLAVFSLGICLLLACAKLSAAVYGHSLALLADALESCLDLLGGGILWFSLIYAAKQPDSNHPYGHGKAESVGSLLIGTLVLLAAAGLAWKSIGALSQGSTGPIPEAWTLAIVGLVIAVKEWLYRFFIRKAKESGSPVLLAHAWEHRSDAMTSAAAFIGILITVVGGHSWAWGDPVAALFACGLILWNGFRILRVSLVDLMDEEAGESIRIKLCDIAQGVGGVLGLEKCRIRRSGRKFYAELHVQVNGQLTVEEGHQIAREVRKQVVASELDVADVLIHIEPENRR